MQKLAIKKHYFLPIGKCHKLVHTLETYSWNLNTAIRCIQSLNDKYDTFSYYVLSFDVLKWPWYIPDEIFHIKWKEQLEGYNDYLMHEMQAA